MMWRALYVVFREPRYLFGALACTLLLLVAIILTSNITLLSSFYTLSSTTWWSELELVHRLVIGAPHALGWFLFIGVSIFSLWTSITITLLVYAWRRQQGKFWRGATVTGTGTILALLGMGCVACGPLLFAGVLASLGATSALLLLPLHGLELGILAVLLLGYATYSAAKVITAAKICLA